MKAFMATEVSRQRGRGKRRCAMFRILVVEDDEPLRSLYKYELEEEGYEVIIAEDGKTALRSLEQSSCDLIILDMVMPEMDGLEALAKIASRQKKIPVVIHTAYLQRKGEILSGLADATLTKSSDLSVLKSTVRELLETYRNREH
jgi:CheY-like chemotaxis protein